MAQIQDFWYSVLVMNKILIIEDDEFLRTLESEKFTKEGFEVLNASSEEEMKSILAQTVPQAILLDLMVPGIDGFQILEQLKSNDATSHIPVIVFSNLSDDESVSKAKKAGADDFLVKSNFSLNELIEKIKTLLAK